MRTQAPNLPNSGADCHSNDGKTTKDTPAVRLVGDAPSPRMRSVANQELRLCLVSHRTPKDTCAVKGAELRQA